MDNYINLTSDNLEKEHLCCAISDKKHQVGVEKKKEWLNSRIKEGHVFRKLDAQGKVFIEYAPLELAWTPIDGDNFIYIYCLWVAGSFKGHGYAKSLLEYCIEDAKRQGKSGICLVSSNKKKPFLGEKGFFEKYGFKVVDQVLDYCLLSLSFSGQQPSFSENVKKMRIESKDLTIYYSPECPFTVNCVNELNEYAAENKIKINFCLVDSCIKAKEMPCIFNNWAVFKDQKFVSNTLLNKNSLDKLLKNK